MLFAYYFHFDPRQIDRFTWREFDMFADQADEFQKEAKKNARR